ncbi:unnamed protein product [Colias eurytheme]|nr:unnamed protein product [Colias eurytheme]
MFQCLDGRPTEGSEQNLQLPDEDNSTAVINRSETFVSSDDEPLCAVQIHRARVLCQLKLWIVDYKVDPKKENNVQELQKEALLINKTPLWSRRRPQISNNTERSEATAVVSQSIQGVYKRKETVEELKEQLLTEEIDFKRKLYNFQLQVAAKEVEIKTAVLDQIKDESMFTRDGVFNCHNAHVVSEQNPKAIRVESSQHRFHLNVWAGVIGNCLVGLHFLEGTLHVERYLNFLQNHLLGYLNEVPLLYLQGMFFMHDGAPPHATLSVREYLNTYFPRRWNGRYGHIQWPPRSPDMTQWTFFVWGTMKNYVYSVEIQNVEQLRERILEAASEVRAMLAGTTDLEREVRRRLFYCIRENGEHFEQFLK